MLNMINENRPKSEAAQKFKQILTKDNRIIKDNSRDNMQNDNLDTRYNDKPHGNDKSLSQRQSIQAQHQQQQLMANDQSSTKINDIIGIKVNDQPNISSHLSPMTESRSIEVKNSQKEVSKIDDLVRNSDWLMKEKEGKEVESRTSYPDHNKPNLKSLKLGVSEYPLSSKIKDHEDDFHQNLDDNNLSNNNIRSSHHARLTSRTKNKPKLSNTASERFFSPSTLPESRKRGGLISPSTNSKNNTSLSNMMNKIEKNKEKDKDGLNLAKNSNKHEVTATNMASNMTTNTATNPTSNTATNPASGAKIINGKIIPKLKNFEPVLRKSVKGTNGGSNQAMKYTVNTNTNTNPNANANAYGTNGIDNSNNNTCRESIEYGFLMLKSDQEQEIVQNLTCREMDQDQYQDKIQYLQINQVQNEIPEIKQVQSEELPVNPTKSEVLTMSNQAQSESLPMKSEAQSEALVMANQAQNQALPMMNQAQNKVLPTTNPIQDNLPLANQVINEANQLHDDLNENSEPSIEVEPNTEAKPNTEVGHNAKAKTVNEDQKNSGTIEISNEEVPLVLMNNESIDSEEEPKQLLMTKCDQIPNPNLECNNNNGIKAKEQIEPAILNKNQSAMKEFSSNSKIDKLKKILSPKSNALLTALKIRPISPTLQAKSLKTLKKSPQTSELIDDKSLNRQNSKSRLSHSKGKMNSHEQLKNIHSYSAAPTPKSATALNSFKDTSRIREINANTTTTIATTTATTTTTAAAAKTGTGANKKHFFESRRKTEMPKNQVEKPRQNSASNISMAKTLTEDTINTSSLESPSLHNPQKDHDNNKDEQSFSKDISITAKQIKVSMILKELEEDGKANGSNHNSDDDIVKTFENIYEKISIKTFMALKGISKPHDLIILTCEALVTLFAGFPEVSDNIKINIGEDIIPWPIIKILFNIPLRFINLMGNFHFMCNDNTIPQKNIDRVNVLLDQINSLCDIITIGELGDLYSHTILLITYLKAAVKFYNLLQTTSNKGDSSKVWEDNTIQPNKDTFQLNKGTIEPNKDIIQSNKGAIEPSKDTSSLKGNFDEFSHEKSALDEDILEEPKQLRVSPSPDRHEYSPGNGTSRKKLLEITRDRPNCVDMRSNTNSSIGDSMDNNNAKVNLKSKLDTKKGKKELKLETSKKQLASALYIQSPSSSKFINKVFQPRKSATNTNMKNQSYSSGFNDQSHSDKISLDSESKAFISDTMQKLDPEIHNAYYIGNNSGIPAELLDDHERNIRQIREYKQKISRMLINHERRNKSIWKAIEKAEQEYEREYKIKERQRYEEYIRLKTLNEKSYLKELSGDKIDMVKLKKEISKNEDQKYLQEMLQTTKIGSKIKEELEKELKRKKKAELKNSFDKILFEKQYKKHMKQLDLANQTEESNTSNKSNIKWKKELMQHEKEIWERTYNTITKLLNEN